MAVKLGLDPERVARVVTTGTGRSFAAEYFIPLTLENKFREGYPVKSAYKDMISAAEISARKNIPLPLVNAATMTFQMAIAEGFGDLSKGGLIRVFERMLGVEFRKKQEAKWDDFAKKSILPSVVIQLFPLQGVANSLCRHAVSPVPSPARPGAIMPERGEGGVPLPQGEMLR